MGCISTFTKKRIDPCEPDESMLCIEDIAHALSLICRAGGQFPVFYSVAQHCVCCAKEALARGYSSHTALACLLHDASEAYIADITRPVKSRLNDYLKFEKKLQDTIYIKFLGSVPDEEEQKLISAVDDCMLYHEFLPLMGRELLDYVPEINIKLDFDFHGFEQTEKEYLALFQNLSGEQ
ncbi:MAG: phosphohydrolase [Acutalibacteraceae bacterium]